MKNAIKDNSNDRKYFLLVPRLVLAKVENPYQLTLWAIVRDVAGEDGECYLSTDDLATLAMMSAGKVSAERKALIRLGLITGDLRRDPGYPQPVWHLAIPDMWEKNIRWSKNNRSLRERIELKSLHHMKAVKEPSPHEDGIPPHETKKKKKKIKKSGGVEFSKSDLAYIKDFLKADPDQLTAAEQRRLGAYRALHNNEKRKREGGFVLDDGWLDEYQRPYIRDFFAALEDDAARQRHAPSKKERSNWRAAIQDWWERGIRPVEVGWAVKHMRSENLSISGPNSITWALKEQPWNKASDSRNEPMKQATIGGPR